MFKLIQNIKMNLFFHLFIVIILVSSAILAYKFFPSYFDFISYSDYMLLVFVVMLVYIFSAYLFNLLKVERKAKKNYLDIANTLGADMYEAYIFGEIGLLSYNSVYDVVWASELFEHRGIEILGKNLLSQFQPLAQFFNDATNKPKELKLEFNQRTYNILHLADMNVLIFKDVTEVEDLYQTRKEEATVIATIALDNLQDIMNIYDEEAFVGQDQEIRKAILDWSKENNILIRKIKDEAYICLMQEKDYQVIAKKQFDLMSKIRRIGENNDVTLSVSIGFGRGSSDLLKLAELSASAIDVALSRGGNQVVVNNFGGHMEFYGGLTDVKSRRNTVRARVLAQSFDANIQNSKDVFIIPHLDADFDAIGAALGVATIVRAHGKNAYLVCEDRQIELKSRMALKDMMSKGANDFTMISPGVALEKATDDSLVVVVDVHRLSMTTAPKLIGKVKKVIIIDHHRRAEEAIDDPVFSYIDPIASSATEMVVELIRYSQKKIKIKQRVATYMFAGILLDTNGFKMHTSTSTFEATMALKEYGADNQVAEDYLKDEYEEFALKNKILSNTITPYFGIVIASAPSSDPIDRTILAKVGQEAMGVKGIKAIFVIGNINGNITGVSARSDGSINVQLIMEKLGGGGHYSAAAAQIQNATIDVVKTELLRLLDLYIREISVE